jgi:carboxyl-terminal processing protease
VKQIVRLSVVIMILCFIACGGGGGGGDDPNAECAKNWKNRYVYELLQDTYLWYDRVEEAVDYADFSSPQALLESIIPPIDRWSYISTAEDFYDYSEEGKFYGMGCSVEFDRSKNLWVRFVYQGSPADDAGINRSDEIRKINGRLASSLSDVENLVGEAKREGLDAISSSRFKTTMPIYKSSCWPTISGAILR